MSALMSALAAADFFGCVVFIATYLLLAPWWRAALGQNVVLFVGGCALLLGLRELRELLAGPLPFHAAYPGEGAFVVVGYLAIGVAVWWRWGLLVRAQMSNLDAKDNGDAGLGKTGKEQRK